MPDKRLGIVLSGGGGKGAYQIGVWKFLREAGLEKYVSALSGASVGALNSVLFASGNLEKAEELWLTKVQDAVLTQDEDVWESRKNKGIKNLSMLFKNPLSAIGNLVYDAVEAAYNGICDRKGLCSLIDGNLNLSFIRSCPINLYAACTRISGSSRAVFRLNDYEKDDVLKILMASSAIPGVFPAQYIGHEQYYDGGLSDNCPVSALEDESCDEILVVHLKESRGESVVSKSGCHVTEIFPSESLGRFFSGTLDFSPAHVESCMDLGYTDCAMNRNGMGDRILEMGKRLSDGKTGTQNLPHSEVPLDLPQNAI